MKKVLILVISLLISNGLFANSIIQKIEMEGSFYQMGQQYVETLNHKLLDQIKLNNHDLYPTDPKKKKEFSQIAAQMVRVAKSRYPKPLFEFIKGEADTDFAREHNLTIEDFVMMDQQLFLAKLAKEFKQKGQTIDSCSFIGSKSSSIKVGRNYDYPREYMRMMTSYPIILSMKHSDTEEYPNKVTMLTHPGVISKASYVNDKGHYISINLGASVGGNYNVIRRQSYLNGMLMTMFRARDFEELRNWVTTSAPDFGYIVNIAGPGKDDLYSIEDAPYDELQGHYTPDTIPDDVFKAMVRAPQTSNTVEPDIDSNEDYLIATNTFRLLEWPEILGHDYTQQTPTFSYQRYHNLSQIMRSQSNVDIESIKTIMQHEFNTNQSIPGATANYCTSDPFYNSDPNATYWTIVFDTDSKMLFARFQQTEDDPTVQNTSSCHSNWTDWYSVRVN